MVFMSHLCSNTYFCTDRDRSRLHKSKFCQQFLSLAIPNGYRFQSVDTLKDFLKQFFGNQHICHLKSYISGVLDNFGSDLNQFYPESSQ